MGIYDGNQSLINIPQLMSKKEDPLEKFNRLYPEQSRRTKNGEMLDVGYDGKLDELINKNILKNNEGL